MPINVAIVEDDADIRQALSDFISASDDFYLMKTFHDAESFIHAFADLNVDVVIMDIGLPGQNGIQTVAQLKPRRPQVQYIMCTVFDDDERLFDSLCVGASGYLLKNTSGIELQEAVKQVYHGGSPMSAAIARRVVQSFQKRKADAEEMVQLTPRQLELLTLLDKGFRYKEIAGKLNLSVESVRTYIRNIYDLLQVHSRTDALNKVFGRF
jgi:DNA-binding NarL/FixJ family response regulator